MTTKHTISGFTMLYFDLDVDGCPFLKKIFISEKAQTTVYTSFGLDRKCNSFAESTLSTLLSFFYSQRQTKRTDKPRAGLRMTLSHIYLKIHLNGLSFATAIFHGIRM